MIYYNTYQKNNRKKAIIISVIALVVILVIKSFIFPASNNYGRRTISFDKIQYHHVDVNSVIDVFREAIIVISGENSYNDQLRAAQSVNYDYWEFYTMSTYAQIKYNSNTADEYYSAEVEYYNKNEPILEQKVADYYITCSKSVYADKFESEYFGEGCYDAYADGNFYTDEIVELMQEEADLVEQYYELYASPVIEYEGKEQELSTILSEDIDDTEYYEVLVLYYDKYNKLLGEIYIDLVEVRHDIADEMGYDRYIDYAYDSFSREYTPGDVSNFTEDIKEYIVPLYKRLNTEGYYDKDYALPMADNEMLYAIEKSTQKMSSKIKSIFNYLENYNLYDIEYSPDKMTTTYQTYLQTFDAPFIFMNSTGSIYDLSDFAHEFGHFTDSYINYNQTYIIEDAEAASQGMEYLLLNYLSGCTDEVKEAVKTSAFLTAVDTYIYQGYYNAFEEEVYSLDEDTLTVDMLNEIAGKNAKEFGITTSDSDEYYMFSWIDIEHFFVSPFYVTSYFVSIDTAIQLYEMDLAEAGAGVDAYLDMLERDFSKTYFENLERVGLKSPFIEGRVEMTVTLLKKAIYED
ncbi:MAG: hypothetical protein A2Y17_00140 [Clostridiales bacterium GWF2_38_85]|nr:MAG: hypothetical protein A2Y17_00140 [Clostridiales bacterium GWF2_38_85]HBL83869.1 hypothetical protein [Clostridiales bacterium]